MHTVEDFNFYYQSDRSQFITEVISKFKEELFRLQNDLNYHLNSNIDVLLVDNDLECNYLMEERGLHSQELGGIVNDKYNKVIINVLDKPSEILSEFRNQSVLVILYEMMYGGAFQDKMKSANLLYLPPWVMDGIALYVSDQWNKNNDNEWRLIYDLYGYDNFGAIPHQFDAIKGASFWKFLDDSYGANAIPTLLYMARLTRKFNSAIYYSFQKTANELYKEWKEYYTNAYLLDQRKKLPVRGIDLSDHELFDIYVESDKSIYYLKTDKWGTGLFHKTLEGESILYRLKKNEYPVGHFMGSIQLINNEIYLFYSTTKGLVKYAVDQEEKTQFDLLNATKIFHEGDAVYILGARLTKSKLFRVEGDLLKEQLMFNGYVADLVISGEDIYYIKEDFKEEKNLVAIKNGITDTILRYNFDIRQLILRTDSLLFFNSNKNGVYNGSMFNLNSGKLTYLTDYRSDILFHQIEDGLLAEYVNSLSLSSLFITQGISLDEFYVYDTLIPTYFTSLPKKEKVNLIVKEELIKEDSLPNYTFQSPVPNSYDFTTSNYDSLKKVADYLNRQNASIRRSPDFFRPKYFFFQLMNELPLVKQFPFSESIESYLPNQIGIRIGTTLQNQFNNKQVSLNYYGYKVWSNKDIVFNLSKYNKNRGYHLDLLHRQRMSFYSRTDIRKDATNYARFHWTLASGKHWELEHGVLGRYDRRTKLATNNETLNSPYINKTFLGSDLQYSIKFDKAEQLSYSSKHWFQFNAGIQSLYNLSNSSYNFNSTVEVKLDKDWSYFMHSELSIRAGNSIGSSPVYYVLGGTSSDMFANYEQRGFSDYKEASYHQLVYGVRGFNTNYRNGNTFGLLSFQTDFKFLQLLYKRPIMSESFSNLAIVGFFDLGSSIYGSSRFDKANALNTKYFSTPGGTVDIQVRNIKNPLIYAFGPGIKTKIYSYSIEADLGFGVENSNIQKPKLHVSLGYPF